MAIYRANEILKMSPKERGEKLDELRAELLREHGVKAAGGAPKNPGRIRALRKTIARILTIDAAEARAPKAKSRPFPAATTGAPARKSSRPARPKQGQTSGKAGKPRGARTGSAVAAPRRIAPVRKARRVAPRAARRKT